METWLNIVSVVIVPLIRSIAGWLNNALHDGIIDQYEVKKLIETSINLLVPSLATVFGFNLIGIDIPIIAPLIAAAVVDWFISRFKKN